VKSLGKGCLRNLYQMRLKLLLLQDLLGMIKLQKPRPHVHSTTIRDFHRSSQLLMKKVLLIVACPVLLTQPKHAGSIQQCHQQGTIRLTTLTMIQDLAEMNLFLISVLTSWFAMKIPSTSKRPWTILKLRNSSVQEHSQRFSLLKNVIALAKYLL